jgi:trimeric autotransporter adhesin
MRRKPGRIALAASSILCSLILAACNCAPTLRYVSVAPASATIFAAATTTTSGETTTTTIITCSSFSQQQFAATGYYSDGSQLDISTSAGWSSSNTNAATITTAGLASAVTSVGAAGGTSVITAASGGATATANLAVDVLTGIVVTPLAKTVPLGGSQQYTATGTFNVPGSSTPVTMDLTTQVTWSVANGTTSSDGSTNSNSIASIGTATGLLTSNAQSQNQGATTVTATICTLSGSTAVTVGPPTAQFLRVTPDSPSIAIGQTVDFTAQLINTDGSIVGVPPPPVTWTSGTTTVASILSRPAGDGLATALTAGTSVITASVGTAPNVLTGMTTLTVSAAVARFAYVPNQIDSSISGYAPHASNGGFTPFGKALATQPQQVIPHPSGLFLYSINGDSTINVFAIDPVAGVLTDTGLAATPIPGGTGIDRGVIDPSGRWLYVVDKGRTSVFFFVINQATGALTFVSSTATTGASPVDVLITPNDQFLYVVNNLGNSVSAFSVGTIGALTAITGPTTVLDSPAISAIDPTGTYLFVPNTGTSHSIVPFTIGTTGSLTAGTTFTTTSTTAALYAVAVDPTSKFLYAEDSQTTGSGNLYALSIGSGGTLTATLNSGNPYPLGSGSAGVAVDPTGKVVMVANRISNTLSVFTAASDGSLTADNTVETGAGPQFAVFANGTAEATSSVAAVVGANATASTLSAFTADSTGALTVVGTPFASLAGNSQVGNTAFGSSVFTSSASAKQLGGFNLNVANTPAFSQIAPPATLPGAGGSVVADTSGTYVYVADTTNKTVASYNTVDLTPNSGPYPITNGVTALATDPQGTLLYALGSNFITPIVTHSDGSLTVETPVAAPGAWSVAAVSPAGKFLAAVDSGTNKIQVFLVTPVQGTATDGQLTAVGTGVSIPGAMTVSSIAFDPLGRFLVVTDSKAGTVTPFTIDSTGKLTAGTASTLAGATQAAFDQTGAFLFVGVNGSPTATPPVPGGVQAYSIATSGALTPVGTSVNADLGTWGVGVLNQLQ